MAQIHKKLFAKKYITGLAFGMLAILLLSKCGNTIDKPSSIEIIADPIKQDSIFKSLFNLTSSALSDKEAKDSLSFLVLPLQLSCESCRKKTIDSIVKHYKDLRENHFIIVSASGGRKVIRSYFLEQNKELPAIENKIFLDSNHLAYKYNLVKDNPVMYYAANNKVYKKVAAIPATVRDDLREFFTGTRHEGKSK